jgi:hypothetical protein
MHDALPPLPLLTVFFAVSLALDALTALSGPRGAS